MPKHESYPRTYESRALAVTSNSDFKYLAEHSESMKVMDVLNLIVHLAECTNQSENMVVWILFQELKKLDGEKGSKHVEADISQS